MKDNIRHLLIVCALGQEKAVVKNLLRGLFRPGWKISYVVVGLGEDSAIRLTEFLSKSQIVFDLLINIGIAGYGIAKNEEGIEEISAYGKKGKLVQCLRIIQGDANKELCIPSTYFCSGVPIVLLTTWVRVLSDGAKLNKFLSYESIVAVDMEGYWIENVCHYFNLPRVYLKILYDEIGVAQKFNKDDALDTLKQGLQSLPKILNNLLS